MKLEIFEAQSGKPSSRVQLDGGSLRHIHSTVKPEDEARYFDDLSFWGDIIVLAGVGLGYHLAGKIDTLPASASLVIADHYPEHLSRCMEGVFSSMPNKHLTVSGEDGPIDTTECAKLSPTATSPKIQIVKHPASFALHSGFYRSVIDRVCGCFRSPSRETRLSNACLLYGRFFLQEESRRALREVTGSEPALLRYEEYSSPSSYESHLQRVLQDHAIDFVLSVNMKGFDGEGVLGEVTRRLDVPVVVWFVDDPYPMLLHQRKHVADHMVAACWEKSYVPYLQSCGFSRVVYLPLATDPSAFSPGSPSDESVPLGFVGSSMGGTFLTDIRDKFLWNDSLAPLVDAASESLLQTTAKPVGSIVHEAATRLGLVLPFSDKRNFTWLCSLAIHTASMKKRQRALSALSTLNPQLFGDPLGWEKLLGSGVQCHADLDYNSQLPGTYRSIAVNLNVTSCQMRTAVNQRVFDIPAAGGFVLSDSQEDLEELFDPDTECAVYSDTEELAQKAKFFRDNEPQRRRISEAARKRVLAHHTYVHRLSKIIEVLAQG